MKKIVLFLFTVCQLGFSHAQQLDALIQTSANPSAADNTKMITDSAYRVYLYSKFDAISGTEIKGFTKRTISVLSSLNRKRR